MLAFLSMAYATDLEACERQEAEACLRLFRDATARAVDSADAAGVPDPRYEAGVDHFARLACIAGDRAACAWFTMGDSEGVRGDYVPLRPTPTKEQEASEHAQPDLSRFAFLYEPLPLPGGGWTTLDPNNGELDQQGVYVAGAEVAAVVDGKLYFGHDEGGGQVIVGPTSSEVWRGPAGTNACGTETLPPIQMVWTSDDCKGPYEVTLHDASTGASTSLTAEWTPSLEVAAKGRAVVVVSSRQIIDVSTGLAVDLRAKVIEVEADGTVLYQDDGLEVRRPDGTIESYPGDSRSGLLPNGDVLTLNKGKVQRWSAPEELVQSWDVPPDAYHLTVHPEGGSFALRYSDGTQLFAMAEGEGEPSSALPAWLRQSHPHVPAFAFDEALGHRGEVFTLRDEEGLPLAGASLDGEASDDQGRILDRGYRDATLPGTLFIDGRPRQAKRDEQARTLTLLPARTVELPLPPKDLIVPSRAFGSRVGPREVLLDELSPVEGPIRIYAEADEDEPYATAGRVWQRDLSTETAWTELEKRTVTAVDESGHPLVGLYIDIEGEKRSLTDSRGQVRVWGEASLDLWQVSELDPAVPTRLEGDRLVFTGRPALPNWTPDPTDPSGAWRGLDPEGLNYTAWIQPFRMSPVLPEGMGEMGLLRWTIEDGDMLWTYPHTRLRRTSPKPKNSKRWFTGVYGIQPGERVEVDGGRANIVLAYGGTPDLPTLEVVDHVSHPGGPPPVAPVRFSVRDGLAMQQIVPDGLSDRDRHRLEADGYGVLSILERTWFLTGGPLAGVQLERGVTHTEKVAVGGEEVLFDWTFVGRERCGEVWCAVLTQRMDGLPMQLVLEPTTLKIHRIDTPSPAGTQSMRFTWH